MGRALGLLGCLVLAGCTYDNSGGDPPPGDVVAHEERPISDDFICQQDGADLTLLMKTEADVDAYVDTGCEAQSREAERARLRNEIAQLSIRGQQEALVLMHHAFGGCVGEPELQDFRREGALLHAWLLIPDGAFMRSNVACPAIAGFSRRLYRVQGAADASDVDRRSGVYNPELPGAPR